MFLKFVLSLRHVISTGESQSESRGLQSHDARSALSWRLQPSHPGLQHRAGRQRLGDHRHPGASEGLVHGPDGADRGHPQRHGESELLTRSSADGVLAPRESLILLRNVCGRSGCTRA